jgi:hypothetical protein
LCNPALIPQCARRAPRKRGRAIIIRPALRDWRVDFQASLLLSRSAVSFTPCFALNREAGESAGERVPAGALIS